MAVSPELVKELRERTSCPIRDCKNALEQCNGDINKAVEELRKKGLADASKVAGRDTAAGRIFSYIHSNNQIGVMLELNCQTDFVANTEQFQELGKDLCLQICAMNPLVVRRADISQEMADREISIYRDQVKDKPAHIQEGIIKGKLEKFYKDAVLLEQNFVKDEASTIEQLIQAKIAVIKENITVKRFVRFQVAEKK